MRGLPDDDKFSKRIADLRQKYELPKDGMPEYLYYTSEFNGQEYVAIPDFVDKNLLWKDILKLTEEIGMDTLWADTVQHYVVYDDWNMSSMGTMF